jgi:hypothetical protein
LRGRLQRLFAQPEDIAAELFHCAHRLRATRTFRVQIRPLAEKW